MATATLGPGLDRTPSPDAGGAAELPAHVAKDLVTRLARAVQRATIYPPAHPSVRLASTPLVDALRGLPCAEVLVGFTSDRVFVGTNHRDAVPYELPWMSARLSARGLSSLRIATGITLDETERLIVWLAGSDDLLAGGDLPAFDGATVTRLDFAAVRFRDAPLAEVEAGGPAELAWHAMSRLLAPHWTADGAGTATLDPVELARLVRDGIERLEGTGVRALGDRLVAVGTELASLPEQVRVAVKGRLAGFVGALSPELRGQLLTASAGDDPAKLSLLGELVDRLPNSLVLEVIQGATLARGSSSGQFVAFMGKLASVAATDPELAEVFESRCAAAGLPGDLAYTEPQRLRAVLTDLLASKADDVTGIAPADYQRRLEAIATSSPGAPSGYDTARHASPTDPAALAMQSARIALLLLQAGDMEPDDRAACLDRLIAALPRALDAWDPELLAGAADLAERLARHGDTAAGTVDQVVAVVGWFGQPAVVEAVTERVLEAGDEPSPGLVALARASGQPLAEHLLGHLVHPGEHDRRGPLARALGWLSAEAVRGALSEICRTAPRRARALLAALSEGGAGTAALEAAQLLLSGDDPALRLDAFRVLFGTTAGEQYWDALVRRGLEDPDPRVLRLVIDEASTRPGFAVAPLAAFVERLDPPHGPAILAHAVRTLATLGTPEARESLRRSLAACRTRLDARSRVMATVIAAELDAGGDAADAEAVRRWRHSPAGWLARLLGGGRSS